MFDFDFPYVATLIAGLAAFAIGVFWYHPKVLGTRWMEARGKSGEDVNLGLRQMVVSLLLWLLAACFYSFLVNIMGLVEGDVFDAIPGYFSLSCLLWVAFVMPPLVMGALYTGYAFEAVSIDAAYQLAGYYVFAIVHIAFGLLA